MMRDDRKRETEVEIDDIHRWFNLRGEELRRELEQVGAERVEARHRAHLASVKLSILVRIAAEEEGMSKREIARTAQISRPGLDDMLKQAIRVRAVVDKMLYQPRRRRKQPRD
jgi:hypothetical protein